MVKVMMMPWGLPARPGEHVLPLQEDPGGPELLAGLEEGQDEVQGGRSSLQVQVDQPLLRHEHRGGGGGGGGGGGPRPSLQYLLMLISSCGL